jgi:hypothetical protein
LIKIKKDTAESLAETKTGLASGIRSALMKVDVDGEEVLLRLKGCGNLD